MAIASDPRANIPRRPALTRVALMFLEANPSSAEANQWLTGMRTWLVWADAYRDRLAAWYVEHQAVAHDRQVEAADLGEPNYCRTNDECKVCAYLLDQHTTHSL